MNKGIRKVCPKGHVFYKTSDCPTCPECESLKKPAEGFMSILSAPARRALENKRIFTLEKLSLFTETELLALHGIGPSTIPKLKAELAKKRLQFKKRSRVGK